MKITSQFKRIFLLALICGMVVPQIWAIGKINVQGVVYGDKHTPVIGAFVRDKANDNVTTTDIDGVFNLTVDEGTKLEIEAFGYDVKTVKVKSQYMEIRLSKKKSGKRVMIKPYAEFPIASFLTYDSPVIPLEGGSAKMNQFGIDFGFRLWSKESNSLWLDYGASYRRLHANASLNNYSYSYFSPSWTEVDGNEYYRHVTINEMNQNLKAHAIGIPIYFSFKHNFSKRISIHAELGANIDLLFNIISEGGKLSGSSYGVYPEYGDLIIDSPTINGFGPFDNNSQYYYIDTWNRDGLIVNASLLLGIGAEVWIAGPLSLDVTLRYNQGLTNLFQFYNHGRQNLPNFWDYPLVNYNGEYNESQPLQSYYGKNRLSQLSVRVGLNFTF